MTSLLTGVKPQKFFQSSSPAPMNLHTPSIQSQVLLSAGSMQGEQGTLLLVTALVCGKLTPLLTLDLILSSLLEACTAAYLPSFLQIQPLLLHRHCHSSCNTMHMICSLKQKSPLLVSSSSTCVPSFLSQKVSFYEKETKR